MNGSDMCYRSAKFARFGCRGVVLSEKSRNGRVTDRLKFDHPKPPVAFPATSLLIRTVTGKSVTRTGSLLIVPLKIQSNLVMSDVTLLLDAAAAGDRKAAADLLPLVYDELRKLAAARMADEAPDQTLQPAALVHEAYLRLIGPADDARWQNRGHFFAAAAEAMRRILVDHARRKKTTRHGGGLAVPPVLPAGEPGANSNPTGSDMSPCTCTECILRFP
jgi:hypothetical protein